MSRPVLSIATMEFEAFSVRIPSDLARLLDAARARMTLPGLPAPSRNAVVSALLRQALTAPVPEVTHGRG